MVKIAIFQYDLTMGGIQKSLLNLLKVIGSYPDYQIDLYLFNRAQFFQEPNNVNLIYLKKYPYFCRFIPFNILKRWVPQTVQKKYDVVIDFNSYSMECAVNAVKTSATKRIIWCHDDVTNKYRSNLKYRILWFFFKTKYQYFDKVVAVSATAKESIMTKLNLSASKVIIIPNLIDTKEIVHQSQELADYIVHPNYYNLISVGRFCHEKGYDILIDLMAKVKNKKLDLYLVGDGRDYRKIKARIKRRGLANIYLLGGTNNPYKYLKKADGFILTSRYEGQGMAILEAKTLGLDLFIPLRLEKSVPGIKGTKNLVAKLNKLKKNPSAQKNLDFLTEYNETIIQKLNQILTDFN